MPQKYGHLANAEPAAKHSACLVCDTPEPVYSWTDYHGEAYCTNCGTAYQLKAGDLAEGETYPRPNFAPKWLPLLRRFWQETKSLNGCGMYMGFEDYPQQLAGRRKFNEWVKQQPEFAALTSEKATRGLRW